MVANKIKSMKDNKLQGVDGISPKLLMKTVKQTNQYTIYKSVQLSLKEGVIPFELKEAKIMPLFIKGSINKSDNYRQVSFTSVICKLLERLIKYHTMDFILRHTLLNSSQQSDIMLNKYTRFFRGNH